MPTMKRSSRAYKNNIDSPFINQELLLGESDAEFNQERDTEPEDERYDAQHLYDEESYYTEGNTAPAQEVSYFNEETDDYEANEGVEARERDPAVADIVARVFAREVPLLEQQVPRRWTKCFSTGDIARVVQVYVDNASAAGISSFDRCSCIVMLNVALGQLLPLRLRQNLAHGKTDKRPQSNRRVQMGNLTTETIEKAMSQLIRKGYTVAPIVTNFSDSRGRTAGTLKPVDLKASVRDKVLAASKPEGCWFAFAMSVMDGYHSVLLLVDHTAPVAKIYWLDQFVNGLTQDVTNSLDTQLTDYTQAAWQAVWNSKKKGYDTMIRLWQLRKPRK